MKNLFCTLLCLIVMSQTAMADDRNLAKRLIKENLDQVFLVLQRNDLNLHEKENKIDTLVSPLFDFPLMAKLTLGKRHWPDLSEETQERFTELFIKKIKNSYRGKLTLYSNEQVVYETAVQEKNKIQLPTFLISKDNKISIIFKLYKTKGTLKIYDLGIEGVSLIHSYRSQFDQFLEKGTIEELMVELDRPLDS